MKINSGEFYWEEATGAIYNVYGTYPVRVSLAEYEGEIECDDALVLKSENEELREKIAELENLINNSSSSNNSSYDISCLFSKILLYSSLNRKIAYNEDDILLYTDHYNSYNIQYEYYKGRLQISYDVVSKTLFIKVNSFVREDTNMKIRFLGKTSSETQYKHHLVEWHISLRTDELSEAELNKRFVKFDFNDVELYKENIPTINPIAPLQIAIQTDFVPATIDGLVDYTACTIYQLPTDFDVDFN